MAIQIASLFVFALGVYLEGAMADNNEWLAKVKELESRVAIAEEKSKTENVKVEEKIVEIFGEGYEEIFGRIFARTKTEKTLL